MRFFNTAGPVRCEYHYCLPPLSRFDLDEVLMLIDQQNAKGGLLGKQLEAVVVDPASDWPLFAEKARELLTVQNVDVILGCWTSVSRKSVLPVIEELNGLLFYSVQYEGEQS